MDIEFRKMTVQDIEKIEWSGTKRHFLYVKDAFIKSDLGLSEFVCAEIGDEVVAYGAIDYERSQNAGYLTMFSVRQDLRSQGIGTKLFNYAHQQILSRGLSRAELSVEQINPDGRRLYERLGYSFLRIDTESWEQDTPDGGTEIYETDVDVMVKKLE